MREECPSGRCWGTRGALALVPPPPLGSQKSSLRGSLAVSFTLTYELNKKVRCLCWQGRGPSLLQSLGVRGQGLPRAGPLATPALAVARAQPQSCGAGGCSTGPIGACAPSTSHPNSMLESQPINAPGRKMTDRHLDCKALRPAQHRSLGYINRESSVLASPRSTRTKGLCTSLG